MKTGFLGAMLLGGILFFLLQTSTVSAEDSSVSVGQSADQGSVSGGGQAGVGVGSGSATPGQDGGATITRESGGLTVSGIASAVSVVDTRTVSGSADGTLRIGWGDSRDRSRGERSGSAPPGAPEIPTPLMFGTGFFVFGLGLLLYRKLW